MSSNKNSNTGTGYQPGYHAGNGSRAGNGSHATGRNTPRGTRQGRGTPRGSSYGDRYIPQSGNASYHTSRGRHTTPRGGRGGRGGRGNRGGRGRGRNNTTPSPYTGPGYKSNPYPQGPHWVEPTPIGDSNPYIIPGFTTAADLTLAETPVALANETSPVAAATPAGNAETPAVAAETGTEPADTTEAPQDTENSITDSQIGELVLPVATINGTLSTITPNTTDPPDTPQKKPPDPLYVPNESFAYDVNKNTEASPWALEKLNEETDFNKATKTLAPQEQMLPKVIRLRQSMQGASNTIDKARSMLQKVSNNKDFCHKCVDVQPTFHIPYNADKYPNCMMKIYRRVEVTLAEVTDRFKREATEIINKGNIAHFFQLRMDRIQTLFTHLVHELGIFHSTLFRALNPVKTSDDDKDTPPATDLTIAVTGVHQLLRLFDLKLLQYLDINRDQLIQSFELRFSPVDDSTLSETDKLAAHHVTETILHYIKAATCTHYDKRAADQITNTAMAKVIAQMEAAAVRKATSAVSEVLDTAELPSDPKVLRNAISDEVTKQLSQQDLPPTLRKRNANPNLSKRPPKKARFPKGSAVVNADKPSTNAKRPGSHNPKANGAPKAPAKAPKPNGKQKGNPRNNPGQTRNNNRNNRNKPTNSKQNKSNSRHK